MNTINCVSSVHTDIMILTLRFPQREKNTPPCVVNTILKFLLIYILFYYLIEQKQSRELL